MKKWLILLLLPLLVACSAGQPSGEVTVFVAAPLSGSQAEGGQTVVGGVRLAAERINRAGGLLGKSIKVVALDDEADDEAAVGVARQVAQAVQQGQPVLGVVGHYNSGQTLVAMQVYKDLPILVITPTASDVSLSQQGYRNFFRVNATDAAQAPVDARFLVETLKAKRIAIVHANNAYGRGLRDQMTQALQALGQSPAGVVEIKEAANTQADAVQRVKALNPDAVFLAGYETEGYVLLPQLREAGVTVPFLCSDGCFVYAFVDEAGKAAEGAYVSAITPDARAVADSQWWKDYQAVESRNPGTYSAAGYSALMVMSEAAKKANALNGRQAADAARSLDLTTLVGKIHYQASGDVADPQVYIFQVKDGVYQQIQPPPGPSR